MAVDMARVEVGVAEPEWATEWAMGWADDLPQVRCPVAATAAANRAVESTVLLDKVVTLGDLFRIQVAAAQAGTVAAIRAIPVVAADEARVAVRVQAAKAVGVAAVVAAIRAVPVVSADQAKVAVRVQLAAAAVAVAPSLPAIPVEVVDIAGQVARVNVTPKIRVVAAVAVAPICPPAIPVVDVGKAGPEVEATVAARMRDAEPVEVVVAVDPAL
jgi:hypothetical protein